jgi:hypothetical protein
MDGLFSRQCASAHGGPSDYEIIPQQVPTSAADMCTQDIHITEIVLTNDTSSAITVNFEDRQTTPAPLLPSAMSVAALSVVAIEFPRGALMVKGVTWSASGADLWARVRGF